MENEYSNRVNGILHGIRTGEGRLKSGSSVDRNKHAVTRPSEGERPVIPYTVKEGDTMVDLAKQYGIRTKDIRKVNDFGVFKHLKAGEQILIPGVVQNGTAVNQAAVEPAKSAEPKMTSLDVAEAAENKPVVADQKISLLPANRGFTEISYKVSRNENLISIAKKFYTTKEEIMRLNGLSSSRIIEGSELKIVPGTILDKGYVPGKELYRYAVMKDDSFETIAAAFSGPGPSDLITAGDIRAINNIEGELRVGQVIWIAKERIGGETGRTASFYNEPRFVDHEMANGEPYKLNGLTCAARDHIPFNTRLTFINVSNGNSVENVRVTDRGAFYKKYGRDWDMSERVAKELGFFNQGLADVIAVITGLPKNIDMPPECLNIASSK